MPVYEMRAEYDTEDGGPAGDGPVRAWHMVEDGAATGLCGRELSPAAAVQAEDVWGTPAAQPFCHSCGALYLRHTA
ncbi:hypothetical protein ACFYWP_14675 [Actinacidiphila glaucinigra]|uniref:hypothetical protein n=1 Tax=Actinacidiphila glaucinigra TaxID=235986 RepID=UPI0036B6BF4A